MNLCKACDYFYPYDPEDDSKDKDSGECHRFPPVFRKGFYYGQSPVVGKFHKACGEYRNQGGDDNGC